MPLSSYGFAWSRNVDGPARELAVVGFHSFPGSGELAMMHERAALIVEAP
jgi:hypothetical protein